MTYIFLDTNIFIHFKAFNDISWETIIQDSNYTIVIAPIVISELDKHKTSSNNKVATKAKNTIDKFRRIRSGDLNINFPINLIGSRPSEEIINQHHLTLTHQDDSLIASIIEYPIESSDEKILVTSDFSLELRMVSFNIKCIVMPEDYRLAPEMDETEKKLKETEKELSEFKNRLPKPTLSFANGSNQLKYNYNKMRFDKDEYRKREMEKVRRNNYHMKKSTENDPYRNLLAIANPFYRVSDSQIEKYNAELDKFYMNSELHLNKEYDYESYLLTCVEIEFFMNNTGTLPAEDIDVQLQFPDGFELVKNLKDEPEKLEVPHRPKSTLDMGKTSFLPDIMPYRTVVKQEDPTLPKLTQLKKTIGYDVIYKLKSLKHGGNVISLGKLFACFDKMENMESFHIDYKLVIGNLSKSIEGKLHIVIDNSGVNV